MGGLAVLAALLSAPSPASFANQTVFGPGTVAKGDASPYSAEQRGTGDTPSTNSQRRRLASGSVFTRKHAMDAPGPDPGSRGANNPLGADPADPVQGEHGTSGNPWGGNSGSHGNGGGFGGSVGYGGGFGSFRSGHNDSVGGTAQKKVTALAGGSAPSEASDPPATASPLFPESDDEP